jgi:DNA replication licensing factor MCM4
MSSPTSRRSNRNSTGGTPRRSNRNSQGPMSDASLPGSDPPNEQAARASQRGTPRAGARSSQDTSQSQAPPTSSPLFFRSSPAGSQSQSQSQSLNVPAANGVNGSSPLRQQNDRTSSQGGQTPRASGALGAGENMSYTRTSTHANRNIQNRRPSTMQPAQMLRDQRQTGREHMALARPAYSFALL